MIQIKTPFKWFVMAAHLQIIVLISFDCMLVLQENSEPNNCELWHFQAVIILYKMIHSYKKECSYNETCLATKLHGNTIFNTICCTVGVYDYIPYLYDNVIKQYEETSINWAQLFMLTRWVYSFNLSL